MLYFNIDAGIRLGRYSLEISLCLTDWALTLQKIQYGCVRYFSLGPIHASITDREKLKQIFVGRSPTDHVGKTYVRNEEE
jgi:hypothetical protein